MKREYMIAFRESCGFELETMAKICKCSPKLLGMLEADDTEVTHPKIARRIARAYRLTDEQRVGMLSKLQREIERLRTEDAKPRHSTTRRQVLQIRDGMIVQHYASLHEAERATGVRADSICKAARGSINKAGGFEWRYE